MHIVRDLVHCEAKLHQPGWPFDGAMKMKIVAQQIDGKWEYFGDDTESVKGVPVMLITLTPLPNNCPMPPYRSYVEMEIDLAGSVDEFFQSFCDDIVAIAAARLEQRVQAPHWTTFTILCGGVYDPRMDGVFELESVREIDYEKLELAAIESPDQDVELPPEFTEHTGFYLQSASGNVGHVLGDPNMSDETKDALRQLIDAAYKAVDRGEITPDEDEPQG